MHFKHIHGEIIAHTDKELVIKFAFYHSRFQIKFNLKFTMEFNLHHRIYVRFIYFDMNITFIYFFHTILLPCEHNLNEF